MISNKDILLSKLRGGESMSGSEQLRLTLLLAVPAILAQLSMCLMSYIDAAMVGELGSAQAAAVGLVSTSTWIFGSFCYANSSGFSVQIAHRCGAKDYEGARSIFHRGMISVLLFSLLLAALGMAISPALPHWLGASPEICKDASDYFLIYAAFLPCHQLTVLASAAMIASGNVKISSITSIAMCVLDVIFNYFFIFMMGMGVKGAAIGTGLATLASGIFLLLYIIFGKTELKLFRNRISRLDSRKVYAHAWQITGPLWLQNLVTRGAYIAATVLIAPLGTIAVAANSFAIIAEGFCYLPGYGMQEAATTLVGQSLGAGRKSEARRFAYISIGSGAAMMTFLAVLMWAFAPQIMGLMSNDAAVIELGAKCLRIEAWAELLYGVSIVAYGCCVGAGDTFVPSIINLVSMWIIRIGLALVLIPAMGLTGYWIAMAVELSVKGVIFAVRIKGAKWMQKNFANSNNIDTFKVWKQRQTKISNE